MSKTSFADRSRWLRPIMEQGWAWIYQDRSRPSFYFDINSTPFFCDPNAQRIAKIIEYVTAVEGNESYGDHIAILSLVADKADLRARKQRVIWRPIHTVRLPPQRVITLEAWLEQAQQPFWIRLFRNVFQLN